MGGDSVAVVIPFRDRGIDPRRAANLKRVVGQWQAYNFAPMIVSDGREGSAQFNRSAAYNTAARHLDAQVLIFAESDMLISPSQITIATAMAVESPGLVVPFTEYRYLSAKDSVKVRGGETGHTRGGQPRAQHPSAQGGRDVGEHGEVEFGGRGRRSGVTPLRLGRRNVTLLQSRSTSTSRPRPTPT